MTLRKTIMVMMVWGIAAAAIGLAVNLIHPHAIDYIRKPPPPVVNDPNVPDPIDIDIIMATTFYEMGEYLFVDSRPVVQYEKGHVAGATNLPWEELEKYYENCLTDLQSRPGIVVYCDGDTCDSSHNLAKKLLQKGFPEVYVFFGGWEEWLMMEMPSEEGV